MRARGERIKRRLVAPVLVHDLAQRCDFAVDRRESGAIGFEIGLPVRQQKAALSRLGVLQQREHPRETELDLERAPNGRLFGFLPTDEKKVGCDDAQQQSQCRCEEDDGALALEDGHPNSTS